jgi:outer membrane lipase/esterase
MPRNAKFVEKSMQLNVMPSLLRRSGLVTVIAACAVLASCGSNSVEQPLLPGQVSRFVAMGDGLADMGQAGGVRYTVNDTTVKTWVEQVANSYQSSLSAQSAGGQGWALGGANAAAISGQVDAYIAGGSPSKGDFVLIDAGLTDLVALSDAVKAGKMTEAEGLTGAAAAGKTLGGAAQKLVNAGVLRIVVAGTYNLGLSPYAKTLGTTAFLTAASLKYNEALQVAMVNLGTNVLYVDAALRYNQLINSPGSFGFANSSVAACTTPTAATCTPSTIVSGVDYNTYVFADDRYFTPAAQRAMGDFAYARMRGRW